MKYCFIIFILIGLLGCSRKKETNERYSDEQISSLHLEKTRVLVSEKDSLIRIDLNQFYGKKNFDFQSLVKEVRLVPLETIEESLVDVIYKVLPTATNIYVYDRYKGGGIVIFDQKGKFVKRIPNGQGPGELSRLYDIDFDEENDQLIAYEHSFLSFYKPDGEFIRQERLPFGFYNIVATPNGYLISTLPDQGNGHFGELKDFTFWVTDKNFKVVSVALPSFYNNIHYSWYRYLYKNQKIMVTQKFNDTIYQYESEANRLQAKYLLDFQDKKLPQRYLEGNYEKFKRTLKNNDYYFFIGEYLDIGEFQVIYLENWYNNLRPIIYRNKKSGNLVGGTHGDIKISELPPIIFPKSAYGNELISWYIPNKDFPFNTQSKMLSETDKAKVRDLTKEDNPVLVFFRLNDF
ncbi:6-bladed beta-propeller [Echinicola rosea]|uniref:6-bladed beta-propeller n=1 Tax=Echinicola rosea TaxID=1807691 RepID=UPI0010CA89D0|nr:6-bladed beta-propeller [Echinicola rosea]